MSLSREDMLKELELLPVWQLRAPVPSANIPVPAPIEPQASPVVLIAEITMPEPDAFVAPSEPVRDEMAAPADVTLLSEEASPVAPDIDRRAAIMHMDWQALQVAVPECQACSLHETRTRTVFGVGDPDAEWLLVGEAPGAEEDRQGEPFVGQAGKLLDNMLAAIQLQRGKNVYIANVLKCRPPQNRDPQGEEVVKCDPFLKRQVELIKPRLIIALGKFAAQSLLNSESTISAMRGKLHDFHGVPVIVTYHPAYLLRNLPDKARAWEDLCFAVRTMQGLQSGQATSS
jgi:DNA polymerase